MSSKSSKRKITVEKGSSGSRPSVFERLGTKTEQRDQTTSNSGFCRHWNNTGNCPFGNTCKNAMFHTLISPSKQRAASKEREQRINKQQVGASSRSSVSRLHSTVIPVKGSGTPPQGVPTGEAGPAGQWEEDWSERSLEHADEKELERRRQQLQRELELQMKKELRRRKLAAAPASGTKKGSRSSSSSSSSSSGSSSSSSGSSSDGSSSSRGRRAGSKNRSKQRSKRSKRGPSKSEGKDADSKKTRANSKEVAKKRDTSSSHQTTSSSSRQRTSGSSKRRKDSSSGDSSGSERRKQNRGGNSQHASGSSRGKNRSASTDRKGQQDRKRPAVSHEKTAVSKRRDTTPPSHKSSLPPARGAARKRTATPPTRPRRRTPSPNARRRSQSPVQPRRRSPSPAQTRRRSPSPVQSRRRSPSPTQTRRRSPSPTQRRRSPSPTQSRRRSPSPAQTRRRSPSPARRRSPSPTRRRTPSPSQTRRRSPSPTRRRSPSPSTARSRSGKRHGSNSRNTSPAGPRRRSASVERKDTRRGHTPPSPPLERGYQQRGGRNSRRTSLEPVHRGQQRDTRQRNQTGRGNDSRQSPDRRPLLNRAPSREPMDSKRADWGRGRDYPGSPPRGHHRSSPDSNGSARVPGSRDMRGDQSRDKSRIKDHDRDRDRRRDMGMQQDKGREKIRGREEGELPSLLSLMTQHPPHFAPQPSLSSRARLPPRDEPLLDHRGVPRERGRFERYDGDRGGEFMDHGDEHHRGAMKRGPPRRELSPPPRQQRPPKPREWGEFTEQRTQGGPREWDRRPGPKGPPGAPPLRQWGPAPGAEEQPRQNRMLPPLSVRNAMQAARRGGATPPPATQQPASPPGPERASPHKAPAEPVVADKPAVEQQTPQQPQQKLEEAKAAAEQEKTKEAAAKRQHEDSEADEGEPEKKRLCTGEIVNSPAATAAPQPVVTAPAPAPAMDLMESDLSDISDDADDILNAEGAEEAVEPREKAEAGDEDEEDRVDDILLDNLDFEDVSDGELEAEEARGGVDALTVDWAALLSQTRSQSGDGEGESAPRSHRWQASQVLSRIGVSLKLCRPSVAASLGITLHSDTQVEKKEEKGEDKNEETKETTSEEGIHLLDEVAGVHMALRTRKLQRESLFQLRDRRGLSAADDLAFRRQLNGLPPKKPGHRFNPSAEPELFKLAVQLLSTST